MKCKFSEKLSNILFIGVSFLEFLYKTMLIYIRLNPVNTNKIFLINEGNPKYGNMAVHIPKINKALDVCIYLLYKRKNYKAIALKEEAFRGILASVLKTFIFTKRSMTIIVIKAKLLITIFGCIISDLIKKVINIPKIRPKII